MAQIKEIPQRKHRRKKTKQQFLWGIISCNILAQWSREAMFPFCPLTRMLSTSTFGVQMVSDHYGFQPREKMQWDTDYSSSEHLTLPWIRTSHTHLEQATRKREWAPLLWELLEWRLEPPHCSSAEIYENINIPSKTWHQKLSDLKDQGPSLILVHQRSLLTS